MFLLNKIIGRNDPIDPVDPVESVYVALGNYSNKIHERRDYVVGDFVISKFIGSIHYPDIAYVIDNINDNIIIAYNIGNTYDNRSNSIDTMTVDQNKYKKLYYLNEVSEELYSFINNKPIEKNIDIGSFVKPRNGVVLRGMDLINKICIVLNNNDGIIKIAHKGFENIWNDNIEESNVEWYNLTSSKS